MKRGRTTTKVVTLQYVVYIEPTDYSVGAISGGKVAVGDTVVHHIPDGGKDLSGDGYLHFHLVLSANDDLMIAEFIEVTALRLGCGPGAFNESFPQVSVSVCSAPCLDLSGTFLIARLQSAPGHKVGGIFER